MISGDIESDITCYRCLTVHARRSKKKVEPISNMIYTMYPNDLKEIEHHHKKKVMNEPKKTPVRNCHTV